MPIYEYTCEDCGHEFEHLVRGREKPACPSCGKTHLTKKFSVPAAHTDGSQPACPVKDAGACDIRGCGGQGCNLADLA